ncbi:hypothetical protein [Clostridium fermenticellae]|nr:hypothetical protein [Clostridium fermenticellae]
MGVMDGVIAMISYSLIFNVVLLTVGGLLIMYFGIRKFISNVKKVSL